MDEEIKINFSRPMLVLKIREAYKAPYHKNKFITVKKAHCESPAEFKKFMHQFTGNWSSGSYDIQFVLKEGTYIQNTIYSTLVRIDIRDGKVVKVWKNSPYSRAEYPIWVLFKEGRKKKPTKKKVVKKKPTKKAVKKKVPKKKKKPERGRKKAPKKKAKPKKKPISKKKVTKKKRPIRKPVRRPKKRPTKKKVVKRKPKKKVIKRKPAKKRPKKRTVKKKRRR